jgi:hypothetical protein
VRVFAPDESREDVGFRVEFPGPFSEHQVVVSGWRVPLLHAQLHGEDKITLVLDDRFGLELSTADAERVVPFLADAIAVALGYNAHPSADDPLPLTRAPHPKPQRVHTLAGFGSENEPA